jgi:ribonuclease HII
MRRGEEFLRERFERLRRFDREFDPEAWAAGRLAGVDEAGVGPLAGPVVAAAVILPADFDLPELFDSKQMSPAARHRCELHIRTHAVAFGVARVSPQSIDRLNILRAMLAAHRRALRALPWMPAAVIVDGRRTPRLPVEWAMTRVQSVVKADALSLAVAAASVVAKETRDRIMRKLDRRYPEYGFAEHKGYSTPAHKEAVRRHGLSPVHRRCFCDWLQVEAEMERQGTLDFTTGS